MRKIFFLIPIIILIIGIIPFLTSFHSSQGKVIVICSKIGKGYLKIEKEFGLNLTNYVILIINNTGKTIAICYIRTNSTTISFNDIYVISNGKYYGDSIPSGYNNITILINGTITIPFSIYLSNGETLLVGNKNS
ncbi:hypothetical protein [Sulfurisphaera javensis]|uniref:hypothetical protein n=1 Tax=Sulfurisphaera javensis TaxID=2049879 RepID=UPI0034E85C10